MSILLNESHANSKSIWVPKGISYVSGSNFTTGTTIGTTTTTLYTSPAFTRNDNGTFVVSATWNFVSNTADNFVPTMLLNGNLVVSNVFVNSAPTVSGFSTTSGQFHCEYIFTNVPSTSNVLTFNVYTSNTTSENPSGFVSYTCIFYPS